MTGKKEFHVSSWVLFTLASLAFFVPLLELSDYAYSHSDWLPEIRESPFRWWVFAAWLLFLQGCYFAYRKFFAGFVSAISKESRLVILALVSTVLFAVFFFLRPSADDIEYDFDVAAYFMVSGFVLSVLIWNLMEEIFFGIQRSLSGKFLQKTALAAHQSARFFGVAVVITFFSLGSDIPVLSILLPGFFILIIPAAYVFHGIFLLLYAVAKFVAFFRGDKNLPISLIVTVVLFTLILAGVPIIGYQVLLETFSMGMM